MNKKNRTVTLDAIAHIRDVLTVVANGHEKSMNQISREAGYADNWLHQTLKRPNLSLLTIEKIVNVVNKSLGTKLTVSDLLP